MFGTGYDAGGLHALGSAAAQVGSGVAPAGGATQAEQEPPVAVKALGQDVSAVLEDGERDRAAQGRHGQPWRRG